MLKVRDITKKSKKYTSFLERNNFVVQSLEADSKFRQEINNTISLCEHCIEELMKEESSAKISNVETLVDKMLGFQQQLTDTKEVLSTITVTEKPKQNLQ